MATDCRSQGCEPHQLSMFWQYMSWKLGSPWCRIETLDFLERTSGFWGPSQLWASAPGVGFLVRLCHRPSYLLWCGPSPSMGFQGLHWQADSLPLAPTEKPGDPVVRNPPAMQEMWVWFLGLEDLLEKEMATCSCILAWKIPWTEEPGGLQSMGSQRVRRDWATKHSTAQRQRRGIHASSDRWQRVTVASWARGEQDDNDFVRMFSLTRVYNKLKKW